MALTCFNVAARFCSSDGINEKETNLYCKNCGKELEGDALFCENCGTKIQSLNEDGFGKETKPDINTPGIDVDAHSAMEPFPIKERTIAQTIPLQSAGADSNEEHRKKKRKNLFIGFVVVILVIVIAVLAFFVVEAMRETANPLDSTIEMIDEAIEIDDGDKQGQTSIKNKSSGDLSGAASFTTASSTSTLPTNGINTSSYDATNLIDDNISSCWCEGANGNGIGESVCFSSSKDQAVEGFMIWNGYQESDYLYDINARPKTIAVYADDDYIGNFELKDFGLRSQKVVLEEPIIAKSLTIKITDVYPGSKYEDCCISEIDFY